MTGQRTVTIGRDAQDNIIATGDHNRVYVFLGTSALEPPQLTRLESGDLAPEEAGALPLPTLVLRIHSEANTWHVEADYPARQTTHWTRPPPWHSQPRFLEDLEQFWTLSRELLENEAQSQALQAQAGRLGEALGAMLDDQARRILITQGHDEGPPPFLIIESAEPFLLALPWELLRLSGRFAVYDGRLDIARCTPGKGAPALTEPSGPVSLLINVSAPADSGLDYETESYYITRALHDHVGIRVNEMGELDDLIQGMDREPPPLGVHFSGHGGPGELIFEDQYGDACPVPVSTLIQRLRQQGPARLPRFFYLACCHGGDAPALEDPDGGLPSVAAELHREGLVQVVAYFGPVYDRQSTAAETAFYAAIARGRRTRDAVRAARLALAQPFRLEARETTRDAGLASGLNPFAWAQLVLFHRGPDYPLGQPVPIKHAVLDAPPAREQEILPGSGRSRLLHRGFIGRRREFHRLRRRLRQGQPSHVVQGLGGLGKSVFCLEALKLYSRQGYRPITLWCAEVEQDPDPVGTLLRQFSEAAEPIGGETWTALLTFVETQAATQPILRAPGQRWAWLLTLWAKSDLPPLVLYLDNLESLQRGPDTDDPAAMGQWRDTAADLWPALNHVVQNVGGRLALVASCRYRHPDFGAALLPFGPLPPDGMWRLLGWFPSLRTLTEASRQRLLERLAGHPRAMEMLDGLIGAARVRWQEIHATFPTPESEWPTLVEPELPALDEQLSEDLLFVKLWDRVLAETSRCLLVRATVVRRPADWSLLRVLAAVESLDAADVAIRRLRDISLLTEVAAWDAAGQAYRCFEVHPRIAELARRRTSEAEALEQQGHRLAGDYLEHRVLEADTWDIYLEAAYHLGEVGETDRAFALLADPFDIFYQLGWLQTCQTILNQLRQPARLNPGNRAWYFGFQGDLFALGGRLEDALKAYQDSLALGETLAGQDPSNTQWQRDLSVSYDRIGDVLRYQGRLEDALKAYQDSLALGETLARQDPSNTQWQRDLSLSYERIGDVLRYQGRLEDALKAYQDSLALGETLAGQDPSNALWETDLAFSCWRNAGTLLQLHGGDTAPSPSLLKRLFSRWKQKPAAFSVTTDEAQALAEAARLLERGLNILYRLRDESRLTQAQQDWIEGMEETQAALQDK